MSYLEWMCFTYGLKPGYLGHRQYLVRHLRSFSSSNRGNVQGIIDANPLDVSMRNGQGRQMQRQQKFRNLHHAGSEEGV
jgi:hypothetical protein